VLDDEERRPRLVRWPMVAPVAALLATVTVALAVAGQGVPRPASLPRAVQGRPAVAAEQAPPGTAHPRPRAVVTFGHHRRAPRISAAGAALFRGLGPWVDIYETTSFADPERALHRMRARGVRTVYIETSNFDRPVPIMFWHRQARFIDAAHRDGLKIVAWYLPGFQRLRRDYGRSMKAIRFRTRSGQRYDGFALDIESPVVRRAGLRTKRLMQLSDRLRATVGPSYPMSAIIPTPLGMKRNPTFWPGFPYRGLHRDYQVFQPMTYFTWFVDTEAGARAYTTACIDIIRRQTHDPQVPIHVIGGISDESTTGEAQGFVQAVRQKRVLGASYYAFHGTTRRLWKVLGHVPDPKLPSPGRRRR